MGAHDCIEINLRDVMRNPEDVIIAAAAMPANASAATPATTIMMGANGQVLPNAADDDEAGLIYTFCSYLRRRLRRRLFSIRLGLVALGVAIASIEVLTKPVDNAIKLHYSLLVWPVATLVILFNLADVLVIQNNDRRYAQQPQPPPLSSPTEYLSEAGSGSGTDDDGTTIGGRRFTNKGLSPYVAMLPDFLLFLATALVAAAAIKYPSREYGSLETYDFANTGVGFLFTSWFVAVAVAVQAATFHALLFIRSLIELMQAIQRREARHKAARLQNTMDRVVVELESMIGQRAGVQQIQMQMQRTQSGAGLDMVSSPVDGKGAKHE